ncbi:hypothetical protein [Portibacter lacus]|nr:hypothetical protein [Portibacter lacus]
MEQYLADHDFKLIYEKGQFKSGYCIVNKSNIIVVNKFFDTEGRINALQEIIPQLNIGEGIFEKQK